MLRDHPCPTLFIHYYSIGILDPSVGYHDGDRTEKGLCLRDGGEKLECGAYEYDSVYGFIQHTAQKTGYRGLVTTTFTYHYVVSILGEVSVYPVGNDHMVLHHEALDHYCYSLDGLGLKTSGYGGRRITELLYSRQHTLLCVVVDFYIGIQDSGNSCNRYSCFFGYVSYGGPHTISPLFIIFCLTTLP